MKTAKDFTNDTERLEYVKGILETAQKIIKGTRDDQTQGYISRDTAANMIEDEKISAFNFIEEFFEED